MNNSAEEMEFGLLYDREDGEHNVFLVLSYLFVTQDECLTDCRPRITVEFTLSVSHWNTVGLLCPQNKPQ